MEFINKLCVFYMDVLSQEYLISYESLVQEATREYRNLVDSNRWEPATSKEKSQDQPSLPKTYNVVIERSTNKALDQIGFKSRRSENVSGSGRGSSAMSDITCHKCGKKSHFPLTCSLSGYGPFYHTCDKLYLT